MGEAIPGAPNVLFMLTDDQPPHSVRRMERTMARFSGGLDLTDAGYCAVPMCGPARAGLLTGLYPHNHGCLDNINPTTHEAYRAKNHAGRDLLTRMIRAGYSTGFFGKFINGFGTNEAPNRWTHPGAEVWHVVAGGQNNYPYVANKQGNIVTGITRNHTAYFGEAAESFMESRAGRARPWFCYLNWLDPHGPYEPTGAFENSHDGERYSSPGTEETDLSDKTVGPDEILEDSYFQNAYEGIEEELETVDYWVNRLFATLARTGQLENTIVVFSSDNGFMLGEHGGFNRKSHPYEESARAPYLVKGPGIPTSGLPDPPLVSHLDITATILAAAGAKHSDTDGRPLQGLADGWRDRLLVEHPVRDWSMVREGPFVYMDLRRENEQLYDLAADPYQLESLHRDPERAGQIADLRAKLETLRSATGNALRTAETA